MYPGGGPERDKHVSGPGEPPSPFGNAPGPPPHYPAPQDPFVTDPGYPQPPFPPPAQGPAQPQPPIGPSYPQQFYPSTTPYPVTTAPPPSAQLGQGLVFAVAAVAIFAILAVVGVAVWVVTSNNQPTADPVVAASASAPASPAAVPAGPADPVEGLVIGSGAVRVDVFVDYQCPPCSQFEESTGEVLAGYVAERRVTLSIHPVAFVDERSKNRYATRAAAAMACAYENGKGAEFHAYLLSHQPEEDTAGPTDENLIVAGSALGLDEDFDACVSGRQRIGWVSEATDAADQYGVDSVPAVYVNDRSVDTTKSSLVTAIDNAR